MSLNKFSGSYENINPYFDKLDADIKDKNDTLCFKGISGIAPPGSVSVLFGGILTPIVPRVFYAINDAKYVELYINEPFSGSFNAQNVILVVIISDIHPDIRPQNLDGQTQISVIGTAGSDYGYSARSFSFISEGSSLSVQFDQNSLVDLADLGTPQDLSFNLRLIYPLQ